MPTKFLQGDLVKTTRAVEYGPPRRAGGRLRVIKKGTPGVLVKGLTGGQWWAYFHGHNLILLGDPLDIKLR